MVPCEIESTTNCPASRKSVVILSKDNQHLSIAVRTGVNAKGMSAKDVILHVLRHRCLAFVNTTWDVPMLPLRVELVYVYKDMERWHKSEGGGEEIEHVKYGVHESTSYMDYCEAEELGKG